MKRLVLVLGTVLALCLVSGCSLVTRLMSQDATPTPTPTVEVTSTTPPEEPKSASLEDIWAALQGYWSSPEHNMQYFIVFGIHPETGELVLDGGYHESEGEETAYAQSLLELETNIYVVTFFVPENTEPGLFEVHDEYYFDVRIDLRAVSSGTLTISNEDSSQVQTFVHSATFEEAYAKYEAERG